MGVRGAAWHVAAFLQSFYSLLVVSSGTKVPNMTLAFMLPVGGMAHDTALPVSIVSQAWMSHAAYIPHRQIAIVPTWFLAPGAPGPRTRRSTRKAS